MRAGLIFQALVAVRAAATARLAAGRSWLASAGVLLLAVTPAAGQFSAQPVILELRPASEVATARFSVRNESEGPLQLRMYAADFDQPEGGGHEFMEPGEHPRSCVSRLQFYPDNLSLEAGATGEVEVRMRPGGATCWSLVFVQSTTRSATGIRVAQRIGVKVYGVSPRAHAEGEIRTARVEDDVEGGRRLWIEFANTGDRPLRPEGEVEIRSDAGVLLAVVPFAPFSVLPGRVTAATAMLDLPLEAGRYLAIPVLDFGGDYLAGGQAAFEIGGS